MHVFGRHVGRCRCRGGSGATLNMNGSNQEATVLTPMPWTDNSKPIPRTTVNRDVKSSDAATYCQPIKQHNRKFCCKHKQIKQAVLMKLHLIIDNFKK